MWSFSLKMFIYSQPFESEHIIATIKMILVIYSALSTLKLSHGFYFAWLSEIPQQRRSNIKFECWNFSSLWKRLFVDISVNAARSSFCLGLELSGSEQDRQHIIRQGSFLRNFLYLLT